MKLLLEIVGSAHGYNGGGGPFLAELIPFLQTPERTYVLNQSIEIARTVPQDWHRARMLSAFAPYLMTTARMEALHLARTIEDDAYRAQALAAIAEQLPEADKMSVLAESVHVVLSIKEDYWRNDVLAEIASRLPPADSLKLAQGTESDRVRAIILAQLIVRAPDNVEDLLSLFVQCIRGVHREEFLGILGKVIPVIARLEGESGSRGIQFAVYETAKWFP